jgi:peptidoglycan/xylan/chitin deacetylase (PgdA/CDA1 family)
MPLNHIYYYFRPLIPRAIQIFMRRQVIAWKRELYSQIWPIDPNAAKSPDEWIGWPENKKFALVLSHDVETSVGHGKCRKLRKVEERLGFKSSFNFVPERYRVSSTLRNEITAAGFEVGIHGLKHDGKLFLSSRIFQERAVRINRYLKEWNAVGFRSPSMHRNLDWNHVLNIEYDMSSFDTDPFEPQPDGVGTIFPFPVYKNSDRCAGSQRPGFPASQPSNFFVELPYTLPQDFTLFILMRERSIKVWKEKLDWIADKGGMALLNTHPDYMNFGERGRTLEEYPASLYRGFLDYIKKKYEGRYWHALPREVAGFWRKTVKDKKHRENQL